MKEPNKHHHMVQVVKVSMPSKDMADFDLFLKAPATLLDVFFVEEENKIAVRGAPTRTVRPVVVFDVDPTAQMWRHSFCFVPAMQAIESVRPLQARGVFAVMDKGHERLLGLYEKTLSPEERVPPVEVLARLAYIESDLVTNAWERLSEERQKPFLEQGAKAHARLTEIAMEVWR